MGLPPTCNPIITACLKCPHQNNRLPSVAMRAVCIQAPACCSSLSQGWLTCWQVSACQGSHLHPCGHASPQRTVPACSAHGHCRGWSSGIIGDCEHRAVYTSQPWECMHAPPWQTCMHHALGCCSKPERHSKKQPNRRASQHSQAVVLAVLMSQAPGTAVPVVGCKAGACTKKLRWWQEPLTLSMRCRQVRTWWQSGQGVAHPCKSPRKCLLKLMVGIAAAARQSWPRLGVDAHAPPAPSTPSALLVSLSASSSFPSSRQAATLASSTCTIIFQVNQLSKCCLLKSRYSRNAHMATLLFHRMSICHSPQLMPHLSALSRSWLPSMKRQGSAPSRHRKAAQRKNCGPTVGYRSAPQPGPLGLAPSPVLMRSGSKH